MAPVSATANPPMRMSARTRRASSVFSPAEEALRGRKVAEEVKLKKPSAMAAPATTTGRRGRGVATKTAQSKPAKAPIKPTIKKFQNEDSFVAGDVFDFSGMESPKGVMTRSRRSSVFVAKPPLMTSTARRSAVKSRAKLDSVMETPDDASFVHKTPAKIDEDTALSAMKSEKKKAPQTPPTAQLQQSFDNEIVFNENTSLSAVKSAKKSARKTSILAKKNNIRPSSVVISPIKKAALQRAFASQIINVKPASTASGFPGTPQPADPSNLLRKNLKRKVEMQLTQKVQELPQNSSPYTLLEGETENGSPAEHFVKMSRKPTNTIVTGTPAPPRIKRSRILQEVDDNVAKVETNNAAVNKAMQRKTAAENDPQVPYQKSDNAGAQIITGDLASLCVVM